MVCEIISVGTELLLGEIVNTDTAYIARGISALGLSSYHQSVVGDNAERLREAVLSAFVRADIVILTGGLGPTCDDITKKEVAAVFGKKLYLDEQIRRDLISFFEKAGRVMTENNLAQAMIPEGATVFQNKRGTAPGIAIEGEIFGETKRAILLPGPPNECEPMFDECVVPYLASLSSGVFSSLNLHLYGIGESGAEAVLRPIMESSVNPTVAPYACEHEVRVRITAAATTKEEAELLCREMAKEIYSTEVGKYIYTESSTVEETKNALVLALVNELRAKKMTFAAAESCTAGMISSRMGDAAGVSDVFLGGVVSYSAEVKKSVLGVSEATLEKYGVVSCECAAEMSEGVRKALSAGISVSVTGIAGPSGGDEENPVGTVCFGVSDERGTYTEKKIFGGKNDRGKIRRLATARAMYLALMRLRGNI